MKKEILLFIFFFVFILEGCLPATQKGVTEGPTYYYGSSDAATLKIIKERVSYLENRLKEEGVSKNNRAVSEGLLDIYRDISFEMSRPYYERNHKIFSDNIIKGVIGLDRAYFLTAEKSSVGTTGSAGMFAKERKEILSLYREKRYEDLIERYKELESLHGADLFDPHMAVAFTLSLGKLRRFSEAVSFGSSLFSKLEGNPEPIELTTQMAGWQLQLGNIKEARELLVELEKGHEKRSVSIERLKESIRIAGIKTPVSSPPGPLKDAQLEKAEKLIEEKMFSEARELLLKMADKSDSPPERTFAVKSLLINLEKAEEEYLEKQISLISMKKGSLDIAINLIEKERYQEVLTGLKGLDEEDMNLELKAIKRKAVDGLVRKESNRAAKIFLMAENEKDLEKKKRYLEQSYEILLNLAKSHPSSTLIDRVKSYAERVKRELSRLN